MHSCGINPAGPPPRPSNKAYSMRPSHALHPFRIKLSFPTTVLTWVEVIFIIFACRFTVHVWLHEPCDLVLFLLRCFWLCISVCVHVCLHVLQLHVEARGHLLSCLFFGELARLVRLTNQRAPGPICLQLSVCLSVGLHRIPPCWGFVFFFIMGSVESNLAPHTWKALYRLQCHPSPCPSSFREQNHHVYCLLFSFIQQYVNETNHDTLGAFLPFAFFSI